MNLTMSCRNIKRLDTPDQIGIFSLTLARTFRCGSFVPSHAQTLRPRLPHPAQRRW
ncbi:hypothetical protein I79_014303 [Cricetulus griseus]|uniref:Uncharacterized protein n=1 Tax=Cricetulus griseus TaxID=10029 RepID=G3HTS5_CRIGR|nr:hypothetical protein I79_014303 [Cricetulus griseus]